MCDSSEGCECMCDCGTAPLSGEEYSGPDCGCDPDYCYSQEYPGVSREGGRVSLFGLTSGYVVSEILL